MIQFWFLWVFITLVVVIVALTLRKEREEMPRKEILRAVETSASSMGLAEKSFLWAFSWLDTRFRIQDYWGMSRDAYYGICLLYTSPSPRDRTRARMPSSA